MTVNGGIESQGFEGGEDPQGQPPVAEETQQQESGTGINPAWNDLLETLPSSLHSQVIPHLQKWDKNYQDGIGKVHSEYEPFKPFIEGGYTPDHLAYGLQLLDAVENRPEEVYQALAEHFGNQQNNNEEEPQVQEEEQGQESDTFDISSHPQFQQLQEIVDTMARLEVQRNSEQQTAQEDQELEQEFEAAKEQHGDFDEQWVMVQLLAGNYDNVDQAAKAYKEFEQQVIASHNRPGPRVLTSGGLTANPSVNPSEMSDKDRRAYVAQMLANAHNQQG